MTSVDIDPHVAAIRQVRPRTNGCEECLRLGTPWVHLRLCLTCGHVGCCDSSPMRHARAHAHTVGHPIVQSLEPGENWRWCYVDERLCLRPPSTSANRLRWPKPPTSTARTRDCPTIRCHPRGRRRPARRQSGRDAGPRG